MLVVKPLRRISGIPGGSLRVFLFLIGLLTLPVTAGAFNLDWSGLYRVEAVNINNPELGSSNKHTNAYINQHLILSPKMTVSDGLNVYSRFDIFNSANFPNSQFGQFFGHGVGGVTPSSADNSNVLSGTQADENIRVTQLYLLYTTEFGSIQVGRAPLQFGLGITHNAGNGIFDHWFDTHDLVAFKGVFGNLMISPMIGKSNEGQLNSAGDDISEYMLQVDYNNLETDTGFGIFFQAKRSGKSGNDFPTSLGTVTQGFQGQFINFYLKRGWDALHFAFEGGFSRGGSGVQNATTGNEIKLGGSGFALELNYKPESSHWAWELKSGYIGGDDPSTKDKYEGYFFDRNYDVGLLLFNHILGQFDVLTTSLTRNTASAGTVPDVETLSNALYVAPGFTQTWSDGHWNWGGRLIWASLRQDTALISSVQTDIKSDLGVETDFHLTYKPTDRFTWLTQLGFLFPGAAYKGGSNGFTNDFAYGFTTKAAVSF